MQEIGLETVGQWKLKLEDKLNIIMPYYNQLYESATLKIDPFNDVDYTKEGNRDGSGTDSNKSDTVTTAQGSDVTNETFTETDTNTKDHKQTTNENGKTSGTNESKTDGKTLDTGTNTTTITEQGTNKDAKKFSDTPQGGLTGLYNDKYLTTAETNEGTTSKDGKTSNDHTNTTTATNSSAGSNNETREQNTEVTVVENGTDNKSGNSNHNTQTNDTSTQNILGSGAHSSTEKYLEHVYGKTNNKSYAKLLMELRDSYINIDLMIIDELRDLFMSVWE